MKKNLIILLLIPFLIAILGVVTVTQTYDMVDADIVGISWPYQDSEAFKLDANLKYILTATGVNQRGIEAKNHNLVWVVENKNKEEENHAKIVFANGYYYLQTLSEGEIIITCKNEKGNVYKQLNGIVYVEGAVLIQSKIKASGNSIDPNLYIGAINLQDGMETDATFDLEIRAFPSDMKEYIRLVDKSDNFNYDVENSRITIDKNSKDEDAFLEIGFDSEGGVISSKFNFKIVEGGINIYKYEDLQYVSSNKKIGVLRKNFESVDNAYVFDSKGKIVFENGLPKLKENNVECFGNLDYKTETVQFNKSDLYHFTTTYNKSYIDAWNEYMKSKNSDNFIDDQIYVCLRIQNDFYGNGYTLNFHNVTYPTSGVEINQADGSTIFYPELAKDDIFRGPLPFYTLGDHNNMPLIEALGQDNVGIYLDGDGILFDDVNVKNCDYGNFFSTLNTVGTVVDVHGDDITIKNCRLQNGKNVLRSFSNMNLVVDNSLLSNARCFLFMTGSNEFEPINDSQTFTFTKTDGTTVRSTLIDYLKQNGIGDEVLNDFVTGNYTNKEKMGEALKYINEALNQTSKDVSQYKGTTRIIDTYFYNSSIASIAFECLFNGPYLYSLLPSNINDLLGQVPTADGTPLNDFLPANVSGISYPTYVSLEGKTRFYNYQTIDKNHNNTDGLDISGLINENITTMIAGMGEQYSIDINIEKFFPIKDYLYNATSPNKELHWVDGQAYINIIGAWYGGGINNSVLDMDLLDASLGNDIGKVRSIDITQSFLDLGQGKSTMETYKNMVLKAVPVVIGDEPFKFICARDGYLFNENPDVLDLVKNARGE